MNNPLKKIKRCESCGTEDPDKTYILVELPVKRTICKVPIKSKAVICEECASLGIC